MKKKLSDIKFSTAELGSGTEWIYSFADIMTILLCFFILYFNTGKGKFTQGLSSFFDQLRIDDKAKSGAIPGHSAKPTTSATTTSSAKPSTEIDQDQVVQEFRQIKAVTGAEIIKENQFLIIKFREVSFFDFAKIELNQDGTQSIQEIAGFLSKIQDRFLVNIIAFTDPSPVRANNRRRWKSNDELSVLRAIHVSDVLSQLGIKKENMYVTGVVAQSLAYRNLNGNYSEDQQTGKELDRYRNIALKLEPK